MEKDRKNTELVKLYKTYTDGIQIGMNGYTMQDFLQNYILGSGIIYNYKI